MRQGRSRSSTIRHFNDTMSELVTMGRKRSGLKSREEETRFFKALRQEGSDMFGKHGAAIDEHHQILEQA